MLSEKKDTVECWKEQRANGIWWYSQAYLFAAADLLYVLQEDGIVRLNTESQKYTSWTWISFEEYSKNKIKAFEEACALETERRDQEINIWLHKEGK